MVKKKGKSKRTSLQDKYKIQKRVVETHRKARKQAKRDAKTGVVRHSHRSKKDPGIPNTWPFKEDLLKQIENAKERAETNRADALDRKKEQLRMLNEHKAQGGTARTLEELMAHAKKSQSTFDNKVISSGVQENAEDDGMRTPKTMHGQSSRRAYLRELKKVIEASDVLLQVLDARDPIGTRINSTVEDAILSHYDKRMVLVLNKIDLIPKTAVSGWLTALRKGHPTVAIKSGTNQHGSGAGDSSVGRAKGENALSSSCGVGVESLLGLLKNYSRNNSSSKKSKGAITVGIIGYPNVGKSSIINTLKRSRAVGVSPRPGFTTSMQEVVLDRNVRLIDSPGVVFDDGENTNSDALLRNCLDADSMDDPVEAVQGLIGRCAPESLMMTYGIPAFPPGDAMVFLAMVAKKGNKVLKGGIPDKVLAARGVLHDWNSGKIPFFTPPPVADEAMAGTGDNSGGAVVVSSFADEFDVNKMDGELMKSLADTDEMDFVQLDTRTRSKEAERREKEGKATAKWLVKAGGDDEDDDEDMMDETSDDEQETQRKRSAQKDLANAEDFDFDAM